MNIPNGKWDEYNWDESSGLGTFSREVEHPESADGFPELVHVDVQAQPSKPGQIGWTAAREAFNGLPGSSTIGQRAVHIDRHGHGLCLGYYEGISVPIPYPGRPPMPKLLYYQE